MLRLSERLPRYSCRFLLLLMLLVFLGLGGRFSAQAQTEPPQKPTPKQLKNILADFEKYTEQARQDWQVPGMAIAIVQDDKVIFAKGFGVKKVGGDDKVDEHTIFQIGSTSKAFTRRTGGHADRRKATRLAGPGRGPIGPVSDV
jgi:CubicO group peptidase (beta-lactamase class C family)